MCSLSSPSYEWMRNLSVHQPNKLHSSKKVSLVFNNIKAEELAEHLTFLEFKAFRRLTVNDSWSTSTSPLQSAAVLFHVTPGVIGVYFV